MRHSRRLLAAIVVSLPVIALAGLPITTGPIIASAATTQPSPVTVLLTPFKSIGESTQANWMSEAIDESLAHDLARNKNVRVVRAPTTGPSMDALALARQGNAQRVVVGSYQTVDDQVRIQGEMVDPANGQAVGQIKVTGAKRDLFKLEDSLAAEVLHLLPGAEEMDQSFTVTAVPSDGFVPVQGVVPLMSSDGASNEAPDETYAGSPYPRYSNNADYPQYGYYGYPYLDGGLFVFVNGGRRYGGGYGSGYGRGHHGGEFTNRQIGGGAIVPTQQVPTSFSPIYPGNISRNPGPASMTPSHGFVGPTGPAAGQMRNGGGGGGNGGGRR